MCSQSGFQAMKLGSSMFSPFFEPFYWGRAA